MTFLPGDYVEFIFRGKRGYKNFTIGIVLQSSLNILGERCYDVRWNEGSVSRMAAYVLRLLSRGSHESR